MRDRAGGEGRRERFRNGVIAEQADAPYVTTCLSLSNDQTVSIVYSSARR